MNPSTAFESILPILAFLVSYGIQQEHWGEWINLGVAGSTILLSALITSLLHGQITSNVLGDIMVVATATTVLQAGALKPLQDYLRVNFPTLPSFPTQPASSVHPQPPTTNVATPSSPKSDNTAGGSTPTP